MADNLIIVGDSSPTGSQLIVAPFTQVTPSFPSASYAATASYALASSGTITNALTASTVPYSGVKGIPSGLVSSSAQVATGSFTGTFTGDGSGLTNIPSASHAVNADSANNANTASIALVAAGLNFTPATASFAVSASWAPGSGTATSASHANNADLAISSSFATSASWAPGSGTSTSASFATNALTANSATSASYAPQAPTSSYALAAGAVSYPNITNKPTLVSSSAQVSYPNLANIPAGLVSSSGQVSFPALSNIPGGLVSSSVQINTGSFTGSFKGDGSQLTGLVSASYALVALSASYAPGSPTLSASYAGNASNAITSSYAVTASYALSNAGTVQSAVSASFAQTTLTANSATTATNASTASLATSASHANVSDAVDFTGITNKPALVSSSAQISYPALSNIPSGLVSSSGQVSYPGLANIPIGIVSSSAQVSFTGITNVPSGLVSSSVQINTGSFSGSFKGTHSGDGSALTGLVSASFAQNALTANSATSASAATSLTFTPASASFAQNALTANSATSASFATSASWAPGSGAAVSASYAATASLASNALSATTSVTASYALTSAGTITNAASASYVSGTIDFPNGIYTPGPVSASAFTGSGAAITGVISSSFAGNALVANSATTATSASFAASGYGAWAGTITGSILATNVILQNSGSLHAEIPEPAVPAVGTAYVHAKNVSGRTMMKIVPPTGNDYVVQPSLFSQFIASVGVGSGTTLTGLRCAPTSSGTVSHPTAIQATGYLANLATIAAISSSAFVNLNQANAFLGTLGPPNGTSGFFFAARVNQPDSGSGATGIRVFAGLNDTATWNLVTTNDSASGHRVGFYLSTAIPQQGANWLVLSKDGTNQNLIDTGLAFSTSSVYDMQLFSAYTGSAVTWRIVNLNTNAEAAGTASLNLPGASTPLIAGVGMSTLSATAKNIRFQQIYLETDR